MAAKKKDTKPAAENVVAEAGDAKLVIQTGETEQPTPQKAGEAGPDSSLKTKKGSPTGASAGGDTDYEGRRGDAEAKAQEYDVQVHTDEKGLEVFRFSAESGDEAAKKALEKKGYSGTSIRGVTPASDPDPNSLGGERDASIMIANGENAGGVINTLGTEANAEATKKLGKADIEDLGE